MATNITQIRNLLVPGVKAVFGDYMAYPDQWREIYSIHDSDKAQEIEIEMRTLGLAQLRAEGAPTAMDTGYGQRNVITYYHRYVSLGFAITRQAIKDDLYKSKTPSMITMLKKSMSDTKNILGSSVLNLGFTSYLTADGVPLFSANHTIDGGTYSNTGAAATLSVAALETATISIMRFRDQAGKLCSTKAEKLIVPPELSYLASRVLNSQFYPGTANNDVNAINYMDAIPKGYRVNQYLTSPTAWFLLTNAPEGFKHYIREAIEVDMDTDFLTDSLLCKAVERYSFGVSNPRAGFGNQGL